MSNVLVKSLLEAYGESEKLVFDRWSYSRIYSALLGGNLKHWLANILPSELLKRSLKDTINSIVTLCECTTFYETFPDEIKTPNYGETWGRFANYIEINKK